MRTTGSPQDRRGVAGRLGGWSVDHPGKAAAIWFGVLIIGLTLVAGGFHISSQKLSRSQTEDGDAAKGQRLLDNSGFGQAAAEEILIRTPVGVPIRSAEVRSAVTDLITAIRRTGRVTDVRSPFSAGVRQFSPDNRAALLLFNVKGKADTAYQRIGPVETAVNRVAVAHGQLDIRQFGRASASKALNNSINKDYQRAEGSSIPLTFLILWIAFGAVVAALLPLVLALTAILIATGIIVLTSHGLPIDQSASSMVLLVGLAVGVDYSLFYVRRTREERGRGLSTHAAISIAAATSGRAVLTSGLTVIIAMSAMLLTGQGTFMGMAEATAIVVAVAMVGSLTVVPALLVKLGDKIDRGRLPFIGRRRAPATDSRLWATIVGLALRRPWATAFLAVSLLVVLALPVLRLQTAQQGATDLPRDLPVMKTYAAIQHDFPGGPQPAQVVISAPNVESPAVHDAVDAFKRAALATGVMHDPITVDANRTHTVLRIDVPLAGNGVNQASQDALHTLRHVVIPTTVGKSASRVYVTGATAASVDFNDKLSSRVPYVFAVILAFAFLLFLWNFRSLVIPLTAIWLNLLSVGAAYGILVAVFQWGWGASIIRLDHTGPITAWLPLFLFVILFGLSMDYHVFILSRIREGHDQGLSTDEAIRVGISRSAGVVTSAAIVMVAVFSTFAMLSVTSTKQMGVGLAAAVLIDATIVRGLLVPAVMSLLGESNWYLPNWLARAITRGSHTSVERPAARTGAQPVAAGTRRAGR
jgi:uncharacterized membrane protein YdfJ with MMPL/SSD domain